MRAQPAFIAAALALLAGGASAAAPNSAQSRTAAAIARIRKLDAGPNGLHAVIALNPDALAEARRADAMNALGPLYGEPVLLKDSIGASGMATTAGSLALLANRTGDAALTTRLREAGAVILGKANLSEWSNYRSSHSISGWTAVGGLVRNPHALDRTACGSSAGSAVAVAAGYVEVAVGAETDGSITCPAAMNGVVGLKPTVGLISRTGVVPISASQDTAGPIASTVERAAALLMVLAGTDPTDAATRDADAHVVDYLAALKRDALKGKRLGVLTYATGYHAGTDAVFARAVEILRTLGAEIVPLPDFRPDAKLNADETLVLQTEFKAGIDAYLAAAPAAVASRSLADLITFNAATPAETPFFAQETFEAAAKAPALTDPAYIRARDEAKRLAGPEGIDRLLRENGLDALIAPTTSPAWRIDVVIGDQFQRSASGLPAVAGYPHLTVPMAQVAGLPVGLSFIGPAWSEARLLAFGYAYEQKRGLLPPAKFRATVDEDNPGRAPRRP